VSGWAYYNEIDPFCAQWLRNLITAGHIAPGAVDNRSITDVQPEDVAEYDQCHFFAGIGVWSRALRGAGWADDRPVWTGSCPCQPFSAAGKQKGFDDERHLWPIWHRLIDGCRPPIAVGEQIAGGDGPGWFDGVSSDMEEAGYTGGAVDICSAGFGGSHIRQRLYWVFADAGCIRGAGSRKASRASESGQRGPYRAVDLQQVIRSPFLPGSGHAQPLFRKGIDETAYWMERVRAYGNAIDAEVATNFIEAVMECIP